jgi:hypothetical protein
MAGLAVALGFVGAAPAQADAAQLTVSPTTGIADGQNLTVTGTGFPAGTAVFVVECAKSVTTHSCDIADAQKATVDSKGNVAASLPARRTFTGADPATGAPTGAVDCATAPGCVITAASDRTTTAVTPVPISFA